MVFQPTDGGNIVVSASTSSAQGTLNTLGDKILITNATSAVAHVKQGSNPTATTADTPIAAGGSIIISKTDVKVAVILSTGTGNVHFTTGVGH